MRVPRLTRFALTTWSITTFICKHYPFDSSNGSWKSAWFSKLCLHFLLYLKKGFYISYLFRKLFLVFSTWFPEFGKKFLVFSKWFLHLNYPLVHLRVNFQLSTFLPSSSSVVYGVFSSCVSALLPLWKVVLVLQLLAFQRIFGALIPLLRVVLWLPVVDPQLMFVAAAFWLPAHQGRSMVLPN